MGARALTSDRSWRYINVRRPFVMIEESIGENVPCVVFEPNGEPLCASAADGAEFVSFRVQQNRSSSLAPSGHYRLRPAAGFGTRPPRAREGLKVRLLDSPPRAGPTTIARSAGGGVPTGRRGPATSLDDRLGAAHRLRGPVERGEEAVAGGVDLPAAVAGELCAHRSVVTLD
jgi:hypothetical protein